MSVTRAPGTAFPGVTWSLDGTYGTVQGTADYFDDRKAALVTSAYPCGAALYWGEVPFPEYYNDFVRAYSGWSGVWIGYTQDYLLSTDTIPLDVSLVIRVKGVATAQLSFGLDPNYGLTLPATPIGVVTSTNSAWSEFTFPVPQLTLTQLLDSSQGFKFGVEVTSGTLDIDVIQLRIWPSAGVAGNWSSHDAELQTAYPSETQFGMQGSASHLQGTGQLGESIDYHNWQDTSTGVTWAEMFSTSGPIEQYYGPNSTFPSGRGSLDTAASDYVISSLDGSQHSWKWEYSGNWLYVDVPRASPNQYSHGVEGTDFIRRPDRSNRDYFAYFQYVSDWETTVVGWNNNVVHVTGSKSVVKNPTYTWQGGSADLQVFHPSVPDFTYNSWKPAQPSVPPGYQSIVAVDLPDADTGTLDVYLPAPFPLRLTFGLIASNSFLASAPTQPPLSPAEGGTGYHSIQGGSSIAISATFSLGGSGPNDALTAQVKVPAYEYWDPRLPSPPPPSTFVLPSPDLTAGPDRVSVRFSGARNG